MKTATVKAVKTAKPALKPVSAQKWPVNNHLLNPEHSGKTAKRIGVSVKVGCGPDKGKVSELQSFLLSSPLVKNQMQTEKVEDKRFLEFQSLLNCLTGFAGSHIPGCIEELTKVFTGYLKAYPNEPADKILDQYSQFIVLLKEIERNEGELMDLEGDIELIQNAYEIKTN